MVITTTLFSSPIEPCVKAIFRAPRIHRINLLSFRSRIIAQSRGYENGCQEILLWDFMTGGGCRFRYIYSEGSLASSYSYLHQPFITLDCHTFNTPQFSFSSSPFVHNVESNGNIGTTTTSLSSHSITSLGSSKHQSFKEIKSFRIPTIPQRNTRSSTRCQSSIPNPQPRGKSRGVYN